MAIVLSYFVSPNKSRLGMITLTSFLMSDSGIPLAFHSYRPYIVSPVFIFVIVVIISFGSITGISFIMLLPLLAVFLILKL